MQQVTVNDTKVEISNLETGTMYNFFVVSRNVHGTSLPSSVLMINITHTGTLLALCRVRLLYTRIRQCDAAELHQLILIAPLFNTAFTVNPTYC